MAVLHVTDQTFESEVKQHTGTVLVDFWAPWCGPCKMMSPVLDEFESEQGGQVKVAKVNVDDNLQTAEQFGIMAIPTLVLFKDGVAVDKVAGVRSKDQLANWVAKKTAN